MRIGKEADFIGKRALVTTDDASIVVFSYEYKGFIEYHAMESVCPHSGGPLHLSDIEDIRLEYTSCQEAGSHDDAEGEFTQSDDKVNDKVFLTCPWHEFKFGVESGRSSEHGLVAEVWQVVVADGFVTLPALQESTIKSIRLFQRTMF
jgi:nitrite reductase/ring-hydroxylating ferredoxin subunit